MEIKKKLEQLQSSFERNKTMDTFSDTVPNSSEPTESEYLIQ